jgi:D-alanyl-D-alanine endopeptidase (penicillin-binding protein 7)
VAQSDDGTAPRKHRHRHLHAVHAVQSVRTGLDQPRLSSGSALVLDESSASVVYAKHADVTAPIASITKLMTAIVVLEADQPMDETLEITRDDQNLDKPTTSRLVVGTRLSRADLMHLALMSSENRAAHALARNYPGGLAACVAAMNAKAAALSMTSSHFVEPTGLSSDNVASPQDLTKLVIAASHNTTIQAYSTDAHYVEPVGRHTEEYRNTDKLVASSDWNIIVQKTGYIAEAGKCLVMKAIIEGRSVIIVLLDSIGKETRLADARRIKKWMETRLSAAAVRVGPRKA